MQSDPHAPRRDSALTSPEAPAAPKAPYETPRLRTGAAFENVLLDSGCNPTAFCPPPKCG